MQIIKHPSVDYNKKYRSQEEARRCRDVLTVANHHNVNFEKLVRLLGTGSTILVAIIRILGALHGIPTF